MFNSPFDHDVVSLSLRKLEYDQWLEIDHNYNDYLQQKEQILDEDHYNHYGSLGNSFDEQIEASNHIISYLKEFHPNIKIKLDTSLEPLDAIARMVQDDLIIVSTKKDEPILSAMSLCFPSGWKLRDKLGKPLLTAHMPVPGYEKISSRVNKFLMEMLPIDKLYWRNNWGITTNNQLVVKPSNVKLAKENPRDNLFIRIERQCFNKLPKTNCILFGIKIIIHPIHILEYDKNELQRALDTIESTPDEIFEYKNMTEIKPIIVKYLKDAVS